MLFDPLFDKFLTHSPLSVMARGCLQYALPPSALDALFQRYICQLTELRHLWKGGRVPSRRFPLADDLPF